jgi:hypothetical protein
LKYINRKKRVVLYIRIHGNVLLLIWMSMPFWREMSSTCESSCIMNPKNQAFIIFIIAIIAIIIVIVIIGRYLCNSLWSSAFDRSARWVWSWIPPNIRPQTTQEPRDRVWNDYICISKYKISARPQGQATHPDTGLGS